MSEAKRHPAWLNDDERVTGKQLGAIRADGIPFLMCVDQAIESPELLQQVDRLYGTTFLQKRSAIVQMVDKATGFETDCFQKLLRFVWNYVFLSMPLVAGALIEDRTQPEECPAIEQTTPATPVLPADGVRGAEEGV